MRNIGSTFKILQNSTRKRNFAQKKNNFIMTGGNSYFVSSHFISILECNFLCWPISPSSALYFFSNCLSILHRLKRHKSGWIDTLAPKRIKVMLSAIYHQGSGGWVFSSTTANTHPCYLIIKPGGRINDAVTYFSRHHRCGQRMNHLLSLSIYNTPIKEAIFDYSLCCD